jgi:allophanate hydrolase
MYEEVRDQLGDAFDETVTVDFEPFVETAELLYGGPWVAERLEAIEEFVAAQADSMHPVVEQVVVRGEQYSALDTFRAFHELEQLKQACDSVFDAVDVIVTPTTGTTYTVEAVHDQPVERNSNLGYYTDYVNLLNLSAVAVPTGRFVDGPGFGVTVLGEGGDDALVASVGQRVHDVASGNDMHSTAVSRS